MCEFCQNHEQGDTLYESSDWDGGIGFDYIRDIKYCPICGKKLNSEDEPRTDDFFRFDLMDESQTEYDKGLKLFADILFDKEKSEQFLKECKTMGIEPLKERGE